MSERTQYHDAATGQFVSAEYAEANPGTTVAIRVAEPVVDPMDEDLDWIIDVAESIPVITIRAAGCEAVGTDRAAVAAQLRVQVAKRLGLEDEA